MNNFIRGTFKGLSGVSVMMFVVITYRENKRVFIDGMYKDMGYTWKK